MNAVVFDFDGTIADSFNVIVEIAYELTKREQLADINHALEMRLNHQSLNQTAKLLKIPRWQWPWLLNRGRKIMARDLHKIPLIKGMDEVFKQLKANHYELFVVSSNSKANVERFLAEKELAGYFQNISGGVGLFDKSRAIKRLMRDNKLKNDSIIYVGDEVRDIVAAKQLNIPCIAVGWGYNSEALLARYSPTVLVNSPTQLVDAISECEKYKSAS